MRCKLQLCVMTMNQPVQSRLSAVLVEDSETLSMMYEHYLSDLGFAVSCFTEAEPALQEIVRRPPNLVLLDLELPDRHGLEILTEMRKQGIDCPCVAMTGHGVLNSASDAMKKGADDFLEKPISAARLQVTVDNLLDRARLQSMVSTLKEEFREDGFAGFVGRSLPMQAVYRTIESAASSSASVFVTGESGTGKELCAQAIHNQSQRSQGPFIAINCGAIPRDLFESEIFGHVKGAFTDAHRDRAGAFEQADGGTLFLDELGEMSLDQQVKLLRVIQSGMVTRVGGSQSKKVDVRIVCATNRDPWGMVQEGRFREDLFYRLNVMPIHLPPLRERGDDVLLLAEHFLAELSRREGKPIDGFSPQAESYLLRQSWSGNVRELRNRIHQLVLTCNDSTVDERHLEALVAAQNGAARQAASTTTVGAGPEVMTNGVKAESRLVAKPGDIEPLWLCEKRIIEQAIAVCGGNVPAAATYLEVSASTLYRKLKTWQTHEEVVQ